MNNKYWFIRKGFPKKRDIIFDGKLSEEEMELAMESAAFYLKTHQNNEFSWNTFYIQVPDKDVISDAREMISDGADAALKIIARCEEYLQKVEDFLAKRNNIVK